MSDGNGRIGSLVVLTALEVEYTAVRAHLTGPLRKKWERSTLYEQGTFPGRYGTWTVTLTQTGAGNTPAAAALERAITAFEPQVALFVGVAGGRKDLALGDVVAADAIYDYQSGKTTHEGTRPRIKTHPASHHMVQHAQAVAREQAWQQRIRPACAPSQPNEAVVPYAVVGPQAVVKPVAAGSMLVADERSETARYLERYCGDAVAVEMEGYGFLHGAYVNSGVKALVVRGISDLLSGKNPAADRHWQPRAAAHAAAFAFELLDTLFPETPRGAEEDLLSGTAERQITAMRELVTSQAANAVPLLVRCFNTTLDPDVRSRAIWALRALQTRTAHNALRDLIPRYEIERLMIREALGPGPGLDGT